MFIIISWQKSFLNDSLLDMDPSFPSWLFDNFSSRLKMALFFVRFCWCFFCLKVTNVWYDEFQLCQSGKCDYSNMSESSDFCFRSFAQLDGIPSICQSAILENGKSSNYSIYLRKFGKTMHFPFGSREGFTQTLAIHYTNCRTQIVEHLFNDLESNTLNHTIFQIFENSSPIWFILEIIWIFHPPVPSPPQGNKEISTSLFPPAPNSQLICWIHRCPQTKLRGVCHIKPST